MERTGLIGKNGEQKTRRDVPSFDTCPHPWSQSLDMASIPADIDNVNVLDVANDDGFVSSVLGGGGGGWWLVIVLHQIVHLD